MTDRPVPNGGEIPSKWLQCNGQQLRKLFQASLLWLEKHQEHVNSLNVFPVPDGDTGTNMLLTMRAAYARVQSSSDMRVGYVAQEIAQGALMGARGNSGVILSQIWRGLARGLAELEVATADDIAEAFQEAADTAYKGVMRPVEGTILTVVREGAEEADDAREKSRDLRFLLERVLERCQQTLERTPEMLPELKQAGVVDSGGQGFVYILEGMLRYIEGQVGRIDEESPAMAAVPAQALAAPSEGELEFPYDVQFILLGKQLDVGDVRAKIAAMGDSALVVGDDEMIKVHVHVKDPGEPLSFGIKKGRVADIVVENMQMQMEHIIASSPARDAAARAAPAQPGPEIALEPHQVAVVAVAAGPGLADIFRSLGAAGIVNGGQTNNPSTEEIYQAIEEVPTNKVVVLPNNKNIILAAEAARDLSQKDVAVVPTRTAPQGISAMLSLNPTAELDHLAEQMHAATGHVASGEITTATRSVRFDGITVKAGEIIGLADGRICASGSDMRDVLATTLRAMEMDQRELLSIYYGSDVAAADAEAISEYISERYPELEIEVFSGGQPHYMYILGAE